MGVVLDGQLEQAAGLLDQQVDLGVQKRMAGGVLGGGGMMVFWGTAWGGCTSSRGTWPMGVPLISRMRSPTWMEFFMSGLMQSGSTLQTAGRQCVPLTPSRVGMCWDTAHEPAPKPMG